MTKSPGSMKEKQIVKIACVAWGPSNIPFSIQGMQIRLQLNSGTMTTLEPSTTTCSMEKANKSGNTSYIEASIKKENGMEIQLFIIATETFTTLNGNLGNKDSTNEKFANKIQPGMEKVSQLNSTFVRILSQ